MNNFPSYKGMPDAAFVVADHMECLAPGQCRLQPLEIVVPANATALTPGPTGVFMPAGTSWRLVPLPLASDTHGLR